MQRQRVQFGGAIPDGPRFQPVGGIPGVKRWDAVLVEGACEQFMRSGVMERDVEFYDGVSRGAARFEQSIKWSYWSFDDGDAGLGGCVWCDFV